MGHGYVGIGVGVGRSQLVGSGGVNVDGAAQLVGVQGA